MGKSWNFTRIGFLVFISQIIWKQCFFVDF